MKIANVYGGEPFKLTAVDPTGKRLVVGWTRSPMDMAAMRDLDARGDDFRDHRYEHVRNRKTGDVTPG